MGEPPGMLEHAVVSWQGLQLRQSSYLRHTIVFRDIGRHGFYEAINLVLKKNIQYIYAEQKRAEYIRWPVMT